MGLKKLKRTRQHPVFQDEPPGTITLSHVGIFVEVTF